MKLENEIVIDADQETVWRELDDMDDTPGWRATEHRRPNFIAGIYEGRQSRAVIVNHLESTGAAQTRWVVYSNHTPRMLLRLVGPLLRGRLSARTQSLMEHIKLGIETRLAEGRQ